MANPEPIGFEVPMIPVHFQDDRGAKKDEKEGRGSEEEGAD